MKIRSDIPPPTINAVRRPWGEFAEIFRKANPGDSVHFTDEKEAQSLKACFYEFQRRNVLGVKISIRKVSDADPEGPGYRVWFVSKLAAAVAGDI